jgi:hypothetical protein
MVSSVGVATPMSLITFFFVFKIDFHPVVPKAGNVVHLSSLCGNEASNVVHLVLYGHNLIISADLHQRG